jgi:hypothetical protein
VTGEVLPARAARPVDGQLRPTVHVSGAPAGLTVGPDEVLVLAYPHPVGRHELEAIRTRLLDSRLRPDQILILAGPDLRVVRIQSRPRNWLARRWAALRRLVARPERRDG